MAETSQRILERDQRVSVLAAEGKNVRDIAAEMQLSEGLVRASAYRSRVALPRAPTRKAADARAKRKDALQRMERVAAIEAMYNQGLGQADIARHFNISVKRVRQFLSENKSPVVDLIGRKQRIATLDKNVAAMVSDGKHMGQIMNALGVSDDAIRRSALRNGITIRRMPRCRGGIEIPPKNTEHIQHMEEMYRQGATLADIGVHFNITREWVRQLLELSGSTVTNVDAQTRLEAKRAFRIHKIMRQYEAGEQKNNTN